MSEIESVKLCRSCGKKNFIFCDVKHEVIKKLRKIVDGLVSFFTKIFLFVFFDALIFLISV